MKLGKTRYNRVKKKRKNEKKKKEDEKERKEKEKNNRTRKKGCRCCFFLFFLGFFFVFGFTRSDAGRRDVGDDDALVGRRQRQREEDKVEPRLDAQPALGSPSSAPRRRSSAPHGEPGPTPQRHVIRSSSITSFLFKKTFFARISYYKECLFSFVQLFLHFFGYFLRF